MGYYVHVPGKGEPTLEHNTYEDALAEAKRLVIKNKKEARIYKTEAIVKVKIEAVVTEPKIGIQNSKLKEFYVGDDVLYTTGYGTQATGTIKSINDCGMLEVTCGGGIKVIHIKDVVTVIN